jgi:cytochrome c
MIKSLFLVSATSLLMVTPANAGGNVAAGELVFERCVFCHVQGNKVNPIGPDLHGVFGRTVGSVANYDYSYAMETFNITEARWDEDHLNDFLKEPVLYLKGTTMCGPAVRPDQERADLIAYLKSQ